MMNVKNVTTIVGGLLTLTALAAHAKRISDLEFNAENNVNNLNDDIDSLERKAAILTAELTDLRARMDVVSMNVEKIQSNTEL